MAGRRFRRGDYKEFSDTGTYRKGQGVSGDESGEAGRGSGHRKIHGPCLGAWIYPKDNEESMKGLRGFKQESHMVLTFVKITLVAFVTFPLHHYSLFSHI